MNKVVSYVLKQKEQFSALRIATYVHYKMYNPYNYVYRHTNYKIYII